MSNTSTKSKIKKHLFAAIDHVPVYRSKDQKEIIGKFKKDEWIGLIDSAENHFLVITSKYFGWVEKSLCYDKTSKIIKVNFENDQPVYFAAS